MVILCQDITGIVILQVVQHCLTINWIEKMGTTAVFSLLEFLCLQLFFSVARTRVAVGANDDDVLK